MGTLTRNMCYLINYFRDEKRKQTMLITKQKIKKNEIEAGKLTRNKKSYKFGSGFIEISFWKIFLQETLHVVRHHQQKQCSDTKE